MKTKRSEQGLSGWTQRWKVASPADALVTGASRGVAGELVGVRERPFGDEAAVYCEYKRSCRKTPSQASHLRQSQECHVSVVERHAR